MITEYLKDQIILKLAGFRECLCWMIDRAREEHRYMGR
jgi:hypothetical protein